MKIAVTVLIWSVVMAITSCSPGAGNTGDAQLADTAKTKYVSEAHHLANKQKQINNIPEILTELSKTNITADTQRRLEYFFYTNSDYKAGQLVHAIEEMGYGARHVRSIDHRHVINGWTTPILMRQDTITQWVATMCDLGYQYDCDLTGWGTNPAR